ncbi:MAG TPA: imelysin family protein, partial [Polyangiaceae bacterium]
MLVGSAYALPACQRAITKTEVLRALVDQVVVPNTAAVAENSRRLVGEIAHLSGDPTAVTLHAAREQWQRALLSWKRADAFRSGPIMARNSLMRVMFWPVRTAAIDALLEGSPTIDDASIAALGVDRRGLFALEHLLYSASDELMVAAFVGPAGERRARLARALASNVALDAEQLVRALGDGKAFADKLADGGQDSLNQLIGQLVHTVENVSASRLTRISGLAKSGRLQATEIEGGSSRMSQQIALTYLRASERLFLGVERGLSDLVRALSSAVDDRVRAAFRQAIAAVAGLGL